MPRSACSASFPKSPVQIPLVNYGRRSARRRAQVPMGGVLICSFLSDWHISCLGLPVLPETCARPTFVEGGSMTLRGGTQDTWPSRRSPGSAWLRLISHVPRPSAHCGFIRAIPTCLPGILLSLSLALSLLTVLSFAPAWRTSVLVISGFERTASILLAAGRGVNLSVPSSPSRS